MELFKTRAGVDLVHVPYQGFPQVVNAILAGQVQAGFMVPGIAMGQVRAGKLKALGVTTLGERVHILHHVVIGDAEQLGRRRPKRHVVLFSRNAVDVRIRIRRNQGHRIEIMRDAVDVFLADDRLESAGGRVSAYARAAEGIEHHPLTALGSVMCRDQRGNRAAQTVSDTMHDVGVHKGALLGGQIGHDAGEGIAEPCMDLAIAVEGRDRCVQVGEKVGRSMLRTGAAGGHDRVLAPVSAESEYVPEAGR